MGLQVCPVFVGIEDLPENALRRAVEAVAAFNRALRECERVAPVRSTAELDSLDGRIGLLLSLEGAEPLGYDPEAADVFWELGARMFALTWNRRNAFADGLGEPAGGGLSRLGEQLVDRLVELGAILDLAHASEATFAQVLARAPDTAVLVSHAACRTICDTPRNLSDAQLEAIAERDGVLGVMMLPAVLGLDATVETVVDHVDHAVAVMGIEHVAIGGDFIRQVHRAVGPGRPDAIVGATADLDAAVPGLAGVEDYPTLVAALRARGYEGERLDAILSVNLLRFLRRALP